MSSLVEARIDVSSLLVQMRMFLVRQWEQGVRRGSHTETWPGFLESQGLPSSSWERIVFPPQATPRLTARKEKNMEAVPGAPHPVQSRHHKEPLYLRLPLVLCLKGSPEQSW